MCSMTWDSSKATGPSSSFLFSLACLLRSNPAPLTGPLDGCVCTHLALFSCSLDEFTCSSVKCASKLCALCILRIFGELRLYKTKSDDEDPELEYFCLADSDLRPAAHY